MKRLLLTAILIAALIIPSLAWAVAGSCTQSANHDKDSNFVRITFNCTGGTVGDAGTIPDTPINTANMALILDKYQLGLVSAYPTPGGIAPDAADVFILDAHGEDLLGSADGGTTANKGANLIHATLKQTTGGYAGFAAGWVNFPVTSTLRLRVSNQATASANWTIELLFVK